MKFDGPAVAYYGFGFINGVAVELASTGELRSLEDQRIIIPAAVSAAIVSYRRTTFFNNIDYVIHYNAGFVNGITTGMFLKQHNDNASIIAPIFMGIAWGLFSSKVSALTLGKSNDQDNN
jgi:hypothetical protein